jgi:hypothetical protein
MFGEIATVFGHRIVIYGPGGIGKSTLCATAPGPVAFFDLDDRLGLLYPQLGGRDVRPVNFDGSWMGMLNALYAPGWDEIRTIVVDTGTRAEELAVAHTLATIPTEKDGTAKNVEGYGYGKGYGYVYDTFLSLLSVLNFNHAKHGRHVIIVCHDCLTTVPNPTGEDWLRYEPRLQSPTSGKASIRLRMREWADHVLFLGYDVAVGKDGKGKGCGTRTLYPQELPHCMAKSMTLVDPLPLDRLDGALWKNLIGEK